MAVNNKAVAEISVTGTEQAEANLNKVGRAGKRLGSELKDVFADATKYMTDFATATIDAMTDIGSLNPAVMMRNLEDFSRMVTKTSIASGKSLEGLKNKYIDLSKANAVMPSQIDAFARSVSKMTHDVNFGMEAFQGMHNAALAFGETDQEQVGFAAYLKNVQGVAGDTSKAVGKLFTQAEKLNTLGGARALRDVFMSTGGEVDKLVTRIGKARSEVEAFQGLLTKGSSPQQAQRIAGGAMGFLGSAPLDIQRTLGKSLFDSEGRYKDPVGAYKELYSLLRRDTSKGGRGLDAERTRLAFQSSMGLEAGSAMYNALATGRLKDIRSLAGISGGGRDFNQDYLNSDIGKADQAKADINASKLKVFKPMLDAKSWLAPLVAENPVAALGAAYAAKTGIQYVAKKAATGLGTRAIGGALAGVGGEALTAPFMSGDVARPESEELAGKIYGEARGKMRPLFGYSEDYRKKLDAAKMAVQSQGVDVSTASADQIEAALKRALESSTVKVQVQDNGQLGAETENDKSAEGRN